MPRSILYITHPQVVIDPNKDIRSWSLNDVGAARIQALARSGALAGTGTVISSDETKAIETATPLAAALGCDVVVQPKMHENDRSATGYLPPAEFERAANAFFAHPTKSVRGWETAAAAQDRIVAQYLAALAQNPDKNVLFVGHGAVGTLLFCYLNGLAISRAHDQVPGGGCYLDLQIEPLHGRSGWRVIEDLYHA